MTCHQALSERLIEITSQPLQDYDKSYVMGPCDPYYGYPDYSYTVHKYTWDISPHKRLVMTTKDDDTAATADQDITSLRVIYHLGGFPFFRSSLKFKTFPTSVNNTIRQFAIDGIKALIVAKKKEDEIRHTETVQHACKHALNKLT